MQNSEIEGQYQKILQLLSNRHVTKAISSLGSTLQNLGMKEFMVKLENLHDTYRNILKYSIQMGVDDPRREAIYSSLIRDLYELADQIRHKSFIQGAYHLSIKGITEHDLDGTSSSEMLQTLADSLLLQSKLDEITAPKSGVSSPNYSDRSNILARLFSILFVTCKYTGEETKHIKRLLQSENVYWYEKSVLISALTLGVIKGFDENRLEILFDCYMTGEWQVSQRAFSGLMLGLYFYNDRLEQYPQIINRLRSLQGDESIERDALMVLMQITKAKATDKLSRKFREEIMPDIMKEAPKIEDRLGLFQTPSDDPEGEKNPKWQSLFEDSPNLISRMEEITRMQVEGMDVFINTFAHLKHFPFFRQIHHWFLPFFKEHPEVSAFMTGEGNVPKEAFIEGIEKSNFICNSDKYSFCFSVQQLPTKQRETLFQIFSAELEGMNEMAQEENILNNQDQLRSIYTQYIQDLYRFMKLYPGREDFQDIFTEKLDFHNYRIFDYLLSSAVGLRAAGDFFFDRDHFDSAIQVYSKLLQSGSTEQELYEKTGYAFERQGNFTSALANYRLAELFEPNKVWNLNRMAACYIKSGELEKALTCYQEIELLDPKALQARIAIGNCLLGMKKYKEALAAYLKVELQEQENVKLYRPIAWCYFVTGKLENALTYYTKIAQLNPTPNDLMNMGHVLWCLGNRSEALSSYKECLKSQGYTSDQFIRGFSEDWPWLEQNGATPADLPLLLDFILSY